MKKELELGKISLVPMNAVEVRQITGGISKISQDAVPTHGSTGPTYPPPPPFIKQILGIPA